MEKLVLIDGNSILYRAFYATPYFATSKGVPTNAVYGFLNMLFKIITDIKPTNILVAFDRKEPTYRHIMYKEYKGTRKPMPPEMVPQVKLIKDVLHALNIMTYEKAGLEADDIIGASAKRFPVETIVITGDKDSFQLVDETTSIYFTKRGVTDHEIYNNENFKEKTGINPLQIIDLKALMGDSSDNIPGVPGVGEKTAKNLLADYNTVEELYLHIDELKGKLKEKIENGKDSCFMSKTLATIDINASLEFEFSDTSFNYPFPYSSRKILTELEFSTFLKKDIFEKDDNSNDLQTENDKTEKNQKIKINTEIITEIMPGIINKDGGTYTIVFDKDISFYDGEKEYRIAIKDNFFDKGLTFDDALNLLKPVLMGGEKYTVILYDKKKIKHMLSDFFIDITAKTEDVILLKYVVDYTQKELSLSELIERADLDGNTPAFSLYTIYQNYLDLLKKDNAEDVYYKIELPLCDVLFEMENAGFKIDSKALDEESVKYREKTEILLKQIKELADCDFNPNSPKQLGEVLFVKLGLKHGKKTKSGYSTNAEVLETLEDAHPIIPLILKYRQMQKLLSTYIDGFKPLIDRSTGLIHTVFNQTVTSTGRLSSKEPNLQNIPVREEEGRELRKLFIPRSEERVLVGADYSQIELRLLAHFSKCEPLVKAFNNGEDIHALTASQVFGVDVDEVSPEQRRSAKAVNFGIIYGISDYGLAKNLKIYPKTAGEYIRKYFEMYPSVKEYMDANVQSAKENGYAITYYGRRRVIPELKSPNGNIRKFGERAAMNMPLQGTAADIIKIAMVNVFNRLKREVPQSKLVLQIHDELIIDARKEDEETVKKILREEMENACSLSVPLTVDVASGETWFDAK